MANSIIKLSYEFNNFSLHYTKFHDINHYYWRILVPELKDSSYCLFGGILRNDDNDIISEPIFDKSIMYKIGLITINKMIDDTQYRIRIDEINDFITDL